MEKNTFQYKQQMQFHFICENIKGILFSFYFIIRLDAITPAESYKVAVKRQLSAISPLCSLFRALALALAYL